MEFLGIGPLEVLLVLIIALIVLGPDEMVKAGATVGKFIRNFRRSETWLGFQRMSRSLKTLPEELARQSGLEEIRKEIDEGTKVNSFETSTKEEKTEHELKAWTQPSSDLEVNIDFGDIKSKETKSSAPEIDQEN